MQVEEATKLRGVLRSPAGPAFRSEFLPDCVEKVREALTGNGGDEIRSDAPCEAYRAKMFSLAGIGEIDFRQCDKVGLP